MKKETRDAIDDLQQRVAALEALDMRKINEQIDQAMRPFKIQWTDGMSELGQAWWELDRRPDEAKNPTMEQFRQTASIERVFIVEEIKARLETIGHRLNGIEITNAERMEIQSVINAVVEILKRRARL